MATHTFVIKARGLPWSSTADEVVKFFSDVKIVNDANGVHFTYTKEGRPSGECFIEFSSSEDIAIALAHDNEHMGKRYIEVKEAKQSEMEWVVNCNGAMEQPMGTNEGVVRLRGLPYGCSKQDIAKFFTGLQISPYGITTTMDQDGRASGDAYVEFTTTEDAEKAMGKHKEKIGHRYIEIFKSSKADIKYVVGARQDGFRPSLMNLRPGPYDRPYFGGPRARGRGGMGLGPSGFNSSSNFGGSYDGGIRRGGKGGPMRGGRSGGGMGMNSKLGVQNSKTGHSVHMRGLPFEATMNDVLQFFSPLHPVDVRLLYEQSGRPKGECDVDFESHEIAEKAMNKDKQNMGHRYIELFLKSSPSSWSNNNNMAMNRGGDPSALMGGGPSELMSGGGRGGSMASGYGGGYSSSGAGVGMHAGYNSGDGYNAAGAYNAGGMDTYNNRYNENVSYPNVQAAGGNFYGSMR